MSFLHNTQKPHSTHLMDGMQAKGSTELPLAAGSRCLEEGIFYGMPPHWSATAAEVVPRAAEDLASNLRSTFWTSRARMSKTETQGIWKFAWLQEYATAGTRWAKNLDMQFVYSHESYQVAINSTLWLQCPAASLPSQLTSMDLTSTVSQNSITPREAHGRESALRSNCVRDEVCTGTTLSLLFL